MRSPGSTSPRSPLSSHVGSPYGAGPHDTTISAASASSPRPEQRPTRDGAVLRSSRRSRTMAKCGFAARLNGPFGALGLLDVARDLVDQVPLARERALVA